mmetsp:Transcript_47909/g.153544  ORF Transcript_47909/g.153544 Transcript_47909/m.153544 type:complete len:559 (-) Transcript_47909:16-1692(-)
MNRGSRNSSDYRTPKPHRSPRFPTMSDGSPRQYHTPRPLDAAAYNLHRTESTPAFEVTPRGIQSPGISNGPENRKSKRDAPYSPQMFLHLSQMGSAQQDAGQTAWDPLRPRVPAAAGLSERLNWPSPGPSPSLVHPRERSGSLGRGSPRDRRLSPGRPATTPVGTTRPARMSDNPQGTPVGAVLGTPHGSSYTIQRGGTGTPGSTSVPLLGRSYSPPRGLFLNSAPGGMNGPYSQDMLDGEDSRFPGDRSGVTAVPSISLFPGPSPSAAESDAFWSGVVAPHLGDRARKDVQMLEGLMKDRLLGKLALEPRHAQEEASRLLRMAFHEVYRRVPSFMAGMKRTLAALEKSPHDFEVANELLGNALVGSEALASKLRASEEGAERLRVEVGRLEAELLTSREQVDTLSKRLAGGPTLTRRNSIGRRSSATKSFSVESMLPPTKVTPPGSRPESAVVMSRRTSAGGADHGASSLEATPPLGPARVSDPPPQPLEGSGSGVPIPLEAEPSAAPSQAASIPLDVSDAVAERLGALREAVECLADPLMSPKVGCILQEKRPKTQ